MERRGREDKRIILTIPRSQWVHRKTRLIKERVLSVMKRNKTKNALHRT
jgi:Fe-S cluster biosynthesis and repair protein YggX